MPPKNKDTRKTNKSPAAASRTKVVQKKDEAGGKEKKSPSEDGAGGKGKKSSSEDEVVKKKDEAGGKEKKSSSKDGDPRTEEITVSFSRLSTSEGEVAPPTEEKASKGDEDATEEDEDATEEDEASGKKKEQTGRKEGLQKIKPSRVMIKDGDFISSAIEYFFTPWHFETFLIVTCTSPKTKEIMVRTYKNKPRSHEGPAIHTEELFLVDVGKGDFPEGSEFVLFSNYSPCPKRNDKRTCCCELLLKTTVFKEKKTKIPQIYYLYLYKNVLLRRKVVNKLNDLRCKGFVIKNFLPGEKLDEFISLFPEKEGSQHSLRTKATECFKIKREKKF